MFKIPKWGKDVPETNSDFGKIIKKKTKTAEVKTLNSTTVNKKKNKNHVNNIFKSNTTKKQNLNKNAKNKRKNNVTEDSEGYTPGKYVVNPNKRKLDETVSENYTTEPKQKKKRKKNTDNLVKENNINNVKSSNNDSFNEEKSSNKMNEEKIQTGHKFNAKKEKLRNVLESHRNKIDVSKGSDNLRQRMLHRLKAAQFRYLNEKLYTSSGTEAKQLFQNDPDAFHTYHEGYQQQLKKWPVNPLDIIVKRISKMPKTNIIADMGCGEAALSKRVPQKVRSFDLVSTSPEVEVCDIAHTPLLSESVDVAVYCLALMGTDLTQYLVEANRVLKTGGHLLIAEVESRFDKVEHFTAKVEQLGFKLKNLDGSHKVFFFMEFVKARAPPVKKSKLPDISLKPCLYKKR